MMRQLGNAWAVLGLLWARLMRWWRIGQRVQHSQRASGPWLRVVSGRQGATQGRRKPDWVRETVLALWRERPHAGYRTLAHCFNLQHACALCPSGQAASVSKSFVAQLLRQYRLNMLQGQLRQHRPRVGPIQTTWGMDLTGLPLASGENVPVLGLIDHGSRAVLALVPVVRYNGLVALGHLFIAVGNYGKPRSLCSDNDAVFKSLMFRSMCALIGVRQQFTDLGSPWQNGRIERFWKTLKHELRTRAVASKLNGLAIQTRMKFVSLSAMHSLLDAFKSSYNTQRPHQSLNGQTPAMVWNKQVMAMRNKKKIKPDSSRPKPGS